MPTKSPSNLKVRNKTSHNSIDAEWDYLSLEYVHGDLKGYKVLYKPVEIDSSIVISGTWKEVVVHPFRRKTTLTGLTSNSKYLVQVLAMNEYGDGIGSSHIQGGMWYNKLIISHAVKLNME